MSDKKTILLASSTVEIPASCPQPEVFEAVFLKVIRRRFASVEQAAAALAQHRAIRTVPAPFNGNGNAAHHYLQACLAVNEQANAWDGFHDELFREFLDFDEDNSDQTPAIPGWTPDFYQLG